jgi:miniconductance mechanosensitive channel
VRALTVDSFIFSLIEALPLGSGTFMLVVSIRITSHDMVRVGDWVSMPKYGTDGDVLEITLNTVKIQNWDKTISTIPTYAFISDSFRNWRGMKDSK